VAVSDVDAAIGSDHDVVGLIELAVGVPRLARDAQAQKLLALRAELVDLVPLGPGLIAREVGNPDVALSIHVDAMRRHHHTLPEVRQHRAAVAIELEDGIDQVGVAADSAARGPAGRARAAALVGPDVSVDRIDIDARRGTPRPARGELTPIAGYLRCRVRQPLAGDGIADLRGALRQQCVRAIGGVERSGQ
jgi:hypothetical protein